MLFTAVALEARGGKGKAQPPTLSKGTFAGRNVSISSVPSSDQIFPCDSQNHGFGVEIVPIEMSRWWGSQYKVLGACGLVWAWAGAALLLGLL